MKKLFLLSTCLLLFTAQSLRAQALTPEIALVRVKEYHGSVTMVITRGIGKSEYLEFNSGSFKKQMIAGVESYYNVLNKLYQEGYILQTTIPATTTPDSNTTTLVLSKTPKP